MLPNRIPCGDHRELNPLLIFDPERLARSGLVGRVLENKDGQKAFRLASESFISLKRVGGVIVCEIEAYHSCVVLLHQCPGASRLLGKQFPTIRAIQTKMVRIIVAAAPLDKSVVA